MLHGKICIRENLHTGKNQEQYIQQSHKNKLTPYALQGEDFPGGGFSWGACISEKTGLGKLLGQVS